MGHTAAIADPVRTRIDVDVSLPSRRTLDGRFHLRWPSVYAWFARAILSLPPRSRLRRALLRRTMLSGWAAFARWDVDLTLLRYAPGYELEPLREFLTVGVRSSHIHRSGPCKECLERTYGSVLVPGANEGHPTGIRFLITPQAARRSARRLVRRANAGAFTQIRSVDPRYSDRTRTRILARIRAWTPREDRARVYVGDEANDLVDRCPDLDRLQAARGGRNNSHGPAVIRYGSDRVKVVDGTGGVTPD